GKGARWEPPSRPAPARGARLVERRASSVNPSAVTRICASGSSTWASKPADTSTSPGSNARTAGSTSSSKAGRDTASSDPAPHGELGGRPRPPPRPAGARVERPLVERDEEDAFVVAKDRLRPVPVMDVPVDDRDSFDPERILRGARRDGDVVEETEPHRATRQRVVSGWPDEGKAPRRR